MEKIKIFILKTPVIMSSIAFLSAFLFAMFNTDFLGMKYMTIEKTLVPTALLFSILYGHTFKEQIPKVYRIKYALYTSFLYILFNIFIIYYSTDVSVLSLSYTCIIVAAPLFCFVIYILSGAITQCYSNGDYEKMEISQNDIPIEIKIQRKRKRSIIGLAVIFAIFSLIILIYFNRNLSILFPLLTVFIIIFGIAKYLIKTRVDNISINVDEEKN